jgi:four helix bundle protein
MHKYEDLLVYQKALMYTKTVRTTLKKFPAEELYGLTSQFRRAAESIVLNITEGAGNYSNKGFRKFFDVFSSFRI